MKVGLTISSIFQHLFLIELLEPWAMDLHSNQSLVPNLSRFIFLAILFRLCGSLSSLTNNLLGFISKPGHDALWHKISGFLVDLNLNITNLV